MTDLNINGVNPNINIQSTTQNQATQNNNNIDSSIFNFDVNDTKKAKLSTTESQDISSAEQNLYPKAIRLSKEKAEISDINKLPGIEITGITSDKVLPPNHNTTVHRRVEVTFIDQKTGREGTAILNFTEGPNYGNYRLSHEVYKYETPDGKLETEKVVRTQFYPNTDDIKRRRVYMYNGEQSYIEDHNDILRNGFSEKRPYNLVFFDTPKDLNHNNPNGRELDIVYNPDNGPVKFITETKNGKPTERRYYDENGNQTKTDIFNSTGKLVALTKRFDTSGNLAMSTEYKYDMQGRTKSEVTENLLTGTTTKSVYDYSDGNYTRQVYDITGNNNTPLYAEVLDPNNNVIERTEYNTDNSIATVIKYEYDEQGNLLNEKRIPPEDLAMN